MQGLITSQELAERLRITERHVRRLVSERRIAYVKVGRCVRFTEQAVSDYIEGNKVEVMSRAQLRRALAGV